MDSWTRRQTGSIYRSDPSEGMDEETSALHNELCRLFDEAMGVLSTLRTLGAPGTRQQASELNKTVTATCKLLRSRLRELEQVAEEQDTTQASLQVEHLVKQHKLQYERVKSEQEKSVAEMKRNTESAWRRQRQALLSGATPRSQIKDEVTAIAASEGITESLRRTRQLMTEQIGATEANTQLIGTSTAALGKTKAELESQKGMFKSSRRLLSTMSWYDVLDKVILYGGVGFFLLVVVYILQKRMLGLTPEFVKSSVSGLVGSSMDKAGALYEHYIRSAATPEDPAKPHLPHFDDLEEIEESDLIGTEVDDGGLEDASLDAINPEIEMPDPGGKDPLPSEDPLRHDEASEQPTGSQAREADLQDFDIEHEEEGADSTEEKPTPDVPADITGEQTGTEDTEEDDPYLILPTKEDSAEDDTREEEEDEYLDEEEYYEDEESTENEEDEYLDVDEEETTVNDSKKDEL